MPAFEDEVHWAAGLAAVAGFTEPPEWVKKAILVFAKEIPLRLDAIDGPNEMTPGILGKVAGFLEAGLLSIMSPTELEKRNEEKNPQLKELRELYTPLVGKMESMAAELAAKQPKMGKPMTPEDVGSYHEGGQETAKFVARDADMSMTGNLCFWMWLLWPDVESIGSRVKVHEWIGGMKLVSCSFKLFEKVCLEIGYRPGA